MTTYFVIRDGVVKMPLHNPTIKADGTVWVKGMPLLDSQSAGAKEIGIDRLTALTRAKDYANIPADAFARIGTNPSGLIVISQAEYRAQDKAKIDAAKAARTPAQVERDRIRGLYRKAYQRRDASDDDNVMDYYRIRGQADAALAKWREQYPEDAKEERRAELRARADKQRELAQGALFYDSDGWLDDAARQARHDEFIAKAEALEAEATNL